MKNRNDAAVLLDRWMPWALGALVVLLYAPALGSGFFFDDYHLVVHNPLLRGLGQLGDALDAPSHRPLTTVTYLLNYAWGGLQPWGYHLVSLLLHWLNGWLAYCLLRQCLPAVSPSLSATSALLFAVHPLHSNAVAYIATRSTLLAAAGVLGALVAYRTSRTARRGRALWYALALAAFTGALLSKETGIVLSGLLILLDLTVWRDGDPHPEMRVATWRRWAPFLLVGAAYLLWRYWFLGTIGPPEPLRPGWFNLGASCKAIWAYVAFFLAPDGLCLTRQVGVPTRVDDPWANAAMLGYVAAVALVVWWLRRRPVWALALGWFMVALFPSHPMGSLHLTAADHHAYLPSVGLVLGATAWLGSLHQRWRCGVAWGMIGILVLAGVMTFQRSLTWRDPVRVWESTVRAAPGDALALNNLGLAYEARGRLDDAERAFRRALRLAQEQHGLIIGNLGRLLMARGATASALPLLQLAAAYDPQSALLWSALGQAYSRLQRYEEAAVMYRRALDRNPTLVEVYNNWGVDWARQGRWEAARALFEQGLSYDAGDPMMRQNLGALLQELERRGAAP